MPKKQKKGNAPRGAPGKRIAKSCVGLNNAYPGLI